MITAVPAIGCMPLLRHQHPNKTGECIDGANYWANKYNQGLQSMLQSLKSNLNDFHYSYFDTYNYLLSIIQNPSTHGMYTLFLVKLFAYVILLVRFVYSVWFKDYCTEMEFIKYTLFGSSCDLPCFYAKKKIVRWWNFWVLMAGFKEVKAACCGLGRLNAELPCTPISIYCSERSDYIFWDRYHPTEMAASVLANAVFSGSQEYVNPVNLNQLVSM